MVTKTKHELQAIGIYQYMLKPEKLLEVEREVKKILGLGKRGKLIGETWNQTTMRTQVNFGFYYSYGFDKDIERGRGKKGVKPVNEELDIYGVYGKVQVEPIPTWMQNYIEGLKPLLFEGEEMPDSSLINVYEARGGIPSHIDHQLSFKSPVFSLRLFTDSVMTFNARYGTVSFEEDRTENAFQVPLPRGSLTIMRGTAMTSITHAILTDDTPEMTASLTLRKILPNYSPNVNVGYESFDKKLF